MDDFLINLTPHLIRIQDQSGEVWEIPPSGTVARLDMIETVEATVMGLHVISRKVSGISGLEGLPSGSVVLVSSMVLDALESSYYRNIVVLAPDTGPTAIRRDGQVWAVTRLVQK